MTESSRPSSSALHEHVLEMLGTRIIAGELPAGTRLNSSDVADSFGVSRGAIREVVRVLESVGLVEAIRRAGVIVQPKQQWNAYAPQVIRWRLAGPDRIAFLHSLSELRSAVEPLAARLAATAATDEQRATLVGAVMGMVETSRAANEDPYLNHDVLFHTTLLEASHNPMLAGLTGVVSEVLRGRTHHELMPAIADPAALRLHQDVASFIAQSRGEAAAAAMSEIVTEADHAVQAMDTNHD